MEHPKCEEQQVGRFCISLIFLLLTDIRSDDPCNAYTVIRNALPNGAYNIICPVRLVLINALRRGNLRGPLQNVLEDAEHNNGGCIRWLNPDLPVLCHTIPSGVVDQSPMKVYAARMVLDTVADLVKPNVFMRSHDIRYGAAHDMTMLPADNAMSDADIAAELNHASPGKHTKKYRGARQRDVWSERVRLLAGCKPTFLNVVFGVTNPILRRVLVTREEVESELARQQPDQELFRTGIQYQKRFADTYAAIVTRRTDVRTQKRKRQQNDFQSPLVFSFEDDFIDNFASRARSCVPLYKRNRHREATAREATTREATARHHNVDRRISCPEPQCLVQSGDQRSFVYHLIRAHNKGFPVQCPVPFCNDSTTFLNCADLEDHVKHTHIAALHQRNALYQPDYPCRVTTCSARFNRAETFDVYDAHLSNTHSIAIGLGEHLPSEQLEDVHLCLYPGCQHKDRFSLDQQNVYNDHLASSHQLYTTAERYVYSLNLLRSDWLSYYCKAIFEPDSDLITYAPSRSAIAGKSRVHLTPRADTLSPEGKFPCTVPGCRTLEPFKNQSILQEHQLKAHDHFLPTTCPVYQCHEGPFISFRELQLHMISHINQINIDDSGPSYKCLFPRCQHPESFNKQDGARDPWNNPYVSHLRDSHDLWKSSHRQLYMLCTHKHANAWVAVYISAIVSNAQDISTVLGVPSTLSKVTTSMSPNATVSSAASMSKYSCSITHDRCQKYGHDFKTLAKLKLHNVRSHSQCYPASCPFEGCLIGGFRHYEELDSHVEKTHLQIGKSLIKAKKWKSDAHGCLVPDCFRDHCEIMTTDENKKHLAASHDLHGTAQRPYLLRTHISWIDNYYNVIYSANSNS